jgi:PAS domain-containing protein
MDPSAWWCEFPGAITVCDRSGIIIGMNARALEVFAEDGGVELFGTNLLECHPPEARQRLDEMLVSGQKNVYTIEKGGMKELIYQVPWYKDGEYAGFVELELELPQDIPHFLRD